MIEFLRWLCTRRLKRGFQTLSEIYAVDVVAGLEREADVVRMYLVILQRTSYPNLVPVLISVLGYSPTKAAWIAANAKRGHVIIARTHLERAELIQERLTSTNDILKVSVEEA